MIEINHIVKCTSKEEYNCDKIYKYKLDTYKSWPGIERKKIKNEIIFDNIYCEKRKLEYYLEKKINNNISKKPNYYNKRNFEEIDES